jgi:hypothetical protein
MKQTKTFTILLFAILLINACSKDNCDDSTKNLFVDKTYLPYIIPYSDTSTHLFLKNGKDTLLFKSQGLKETIEVQKGNDENDCRTYYLQKFSLTMTASDTDFFRINYYKSFSGLLANDYEIVSGKIYSMSDVYSSEDYISYFPMVKSITILNKTYDSIKISINQKNDTVISRPKIGILKVKSDKFIYELIN